MRKVPIEFTEKVTKAEELIHEALDLCKPQPGDEFETKTDEFRYLMCLTLLRPAVEGVHSLALFAKRTDDELNKFVSEADETMTTACRNLRMNMLTDMLGDILKGEFAPPL